MAYKIEWTEDALEDMEKVISYLIMNWPNGQADRFEQITLARLQTLTGEPFIGIISMANNDIRSIVLTKHNKL